MNENDNMIERNSDCDNGGDLMTITISNPRHNAFIMNGGVDIVLTPFVPGQKTYKQIRIQRDFEEFRDMSAMKFKIPVIPEYSYRVIGSFRAKFGTLSPGKEMIFPGEIERLMKNLGCDVKYDFIFKRYSKKVDNGSDEIVDYSWLGRGKKDSAIDCARACYDDNENCNEGWSYQLSTKRCIFYTSPIDLEIMQPDNSINEDRKTIGWITGLKSCHRAGVYSILGIEIKIDVNDEIFFY